MGRRAKWGIAEVGLLGPGDLCLLAMLPRQVRRIESVARTGIARWTGWPGKEQSVIGGGAVTCIAEIRWHWLAEAEKFVEIE